MGGFLPGSRPRWHGGDCPDAEEAWLWPDQESTELREACQRHHQQHQSSPEKWGLLGREEGTDFQGNRETDSKSTSLTTSILLQPEESLRGKHTFCVNAVSLWINKLDFCDSIVYKRLSGFWIYETWGTLKCVPPFFTLHHYLFINDVKYLIVKCLKSEVLYNLWDLCLSVCFTENGSEFFLRIWTGL